MSLESVDFLRKPRTPALGVALLLVGLGVLSGALWLDHQARQERQALDLAQAQARAASAAEARHVVRAASAPSPVQERRLARARDMLDRPWLAALRAVEGAAAEPVVLMGLSVDPQSGRMRIDAEAPSLDHAIAYAQRLDLDGTLKPAQITSHEFISDSASPQRITLRFTVLAQWRIR